MNDFGYGQLAQSWFALASGGLVGTGLGRSSPDLIPYPASDFILSAFGEARDARDRAILLLFVELIGRGLRIALDRDDAFGRLLTNRPHDDDRAADVHDRRRRDAPDPLTGVPSPSSPTGVRAA